LHNDPIPRNRLNAAVLRWYAGDDDRASCPGVSCCRYTGGECQPRLRYCSEDDWYQEYHWCVTQPSDLLTHAENPMASERRLVGNQIGASRSLRCMTTLAMSEQSDSFVAEVELRRKWSIETSLLDTVFRMHRKTMLLKDCWLLKRHCNQADGDLVEKNLLAIGRGDRLECKVNWRVRLRGGDRRTKR
jgi:hypothetical protein